MDEEAFIAWRENPVTQWFMAAFRNSAKLAEETWKQESWTTGECDQRRLDALREAHKAYSSVHEADFSDIEARQGE